MKKILLLLAVAISTTALFAQENETTMYEQGNESAFNKWSIDLGGGLHNAARPYTAGYFNETAAPYQASLGIRYMMNEKFGFRASFGFNDIQGDDRSLPFETQYYRATFEGVLNAGNILQFHEWSNSFGLLIHAGGGVSILDVRSLVDNRYEDTMMNVVFGITPQIKISDRIVFNVDASIVGNIGMDTTWDGKTRLSERGVDGSTNRGFDSSLYNFSAGFSIYLGKNETHADWYVEDNDLMSEIEELEARLAKVETDLIDTDQDGVADYLDREQNTMSGVAVDTKGIAIDKNKNGIPDEIESSLDERFLLRNEYNPNSGGTTSAGGTIKELLDNGYVNVYFKFNSTTPETYSLEAINYLKVYMAENTGATAQLVGYADEIGNESYNRDLSAKRAKKVYDILVASGVAANRLSHTGNGEDTSVNKNSSEARQLVRRVTFKLN